MRELGEQYNALTLVSAYLEGLEGAARPEATNRRAYLGVLQPAAAAARTLRRD